MSLARTCARSTASRAGGGCRGDDAVVESFFASLKVEGFHERRFVTPEQVEAEVGDYIERFYNRQRRHSTLGHVSPVVFELRHVA